MQSREDIKLALENIANKYKMQGESLDILIGFLSYALYHEQIEIINTAKEKSLSTASLINSKITLCNDYMYSVYRGKNPIVNLNLVFNSILSKNKFDLLYEANSFKVYTSQALNFAPTVATNGIRVPELVTGIITSSTIIEYVPEITASNRYYIDVKDNTGLLANNLDENIYIYKVDPLTGNQIEYPTTRLFLDHCRSLASDNLIFVMTIPNYGIRLFKKGYWNIDEEIHIKVIPYTELSSLEADQLKKINIPGTQLVGDEDYYQQNYNLDGDPHSHSYKLSVYKEIPRDNVDTLTYQANFAKSVSSTILCNNDIHYLFQEVFKDKVLDSVYELVVDEDNVTTFKLIIYYITRPYLYALTDEEKTSFLNNYSSYFITPNVDIIQAEQINVSVALNIVADENIEVINKIQLILDQYSDKLGIKLNPKLINAEIAKLDQIYYIDSINYSITQDQMDKIKSNQYYKFSVTLSYKSKLNETSF